jgi:SAM-dependent methyltransferase
MPSTDYVFAAPSIQVPLVGPKSDEAEVRHHMSGQAPPPAGDGVSDDYRSSHCAPGYGEHYNKTYEAGYYGALWEKIEGPLLREVLRPMGGAGRKCLDFACGTGRITNLVAEIFPEVVGVDVSEPMLACARVPRNVRLRHVDITAEPLEESFDVITAFRFFLNAEERLKHEALTSIRSQLKEDGRLVCNIHMNATSPVGVACRLLNRLFGRTVRNALSAGRFKQILISSGFVVERIIPYGYLPRPGHLLPHFCEVSIMPVERTAKGLGVPGWLAQHFLVIARKR